ncbi:MAG: sterol desaturase family protein [Spirosomataceae bacterium]
MYQKNALKKTITFGLYPFLLIFGIGLCILTTVFNWNVKGAFTAMAAGRFVLMLAIEFVFPLKEKWKMTIKSFIRDLKYAAFVGTTGFGFKYLIGLLAFDYAGRKGILSGLPLFWGIVSALLIYEFLQYWFHRISHEAKGRFGQFLWKIHAAHHLPDKVYLLMHPVAHPLNAIVVMLISQIVFVGLGVDSKVLLFVNTIMGINGLVSHFNVDIRAGWLNYIFITAELHRYHHSNKLDEAQNFGAIISFWDIIFGTFNYKKDQVPESLGITNPENYPDSNEIFKVMSLPFRK